MSTEIFDIYDEQLKYIGTATREEAHREGYWHRTFHCWVYEQQQDELYIAFQQRQAIKDTNPLCFDITVAGHLCAGETVQDAVREIKEEIGLTVAFDQLHYLMQVKEQSTDVHHGVAFKDFEFSEVFALENPCPLHTWSFQRDEVLAVYFAPLKRLQQLFLGGIDQLEVNGYIQDEDKQDEHGMIAHQATITKQQFVPRDDQYYLNIFEAIATRITLEG